MAITVGRRKGDAALFRIHVLPLVGKELRPLFILLFFILPLALLAAVAPDAQTIALNEANTVDAEFRVGAAGKIAVVSSLRTARRRR